MLHQCNFIKYAINILKIQHVKDDEDTSKKSAFWKSWTIFHGRAFAYETNAVHLALQ